jgi:primosomal protein N'
MPYYDILLKKVPHALTYQSDENIGIGSLVSVSMNKKNAHGIVLSQGEKPSFTCENIEEIVIPGAVSPLQIRLAIWMSEYYFASLSKCVALFVPPVIWDGKR